MEVIYAGLRQTPEDIAAIALQEDVDVIGLSMHNGAHLTLTPAVVSAVRSLGLATPVIVGGIVPAVDVEHLERAGAVAVLGPGASSEDIVAVVEAAASSNANHPDTTVP
jgi:methylmalonyl-CoA mutase cobalamin-binding domain/chain